MLLAVLATLALAVYVLVAEPAGLRFIARELPHVTSAIAIGDVSGRLIDDAELRALRIGTAPGSITTIQRLHLRWAPRALLHGEFHVLALDIEGLRVVPGTQPSPPSTTPLQLPSRLPLDVRVDIARLRGLRVDGASPFVLDGAELVARWIGDVLTIERLDSALPQTGPLHLVGEARLSAQRIDFAKLQLSGPGIVELQGPFGIGEAESRLHVEWSAWKLPLQAEQPQIEDLHGSADFSGKLSDYALKLAADARSGKLPLHLQLDGHGSTQRFDIAELLLKTREGSARAQGAIGWAPQLVAELKLALDKLDPAAFAPSWNGQLNGELNLHTLSGTVAKAGDPPRIGYQLVLRDSQLRGYPLTLDAQGSADASSAVIEHAQLGAAQGRLEIEGKAAWSPVLRLDAEARLAQLNPGVFAPRWNGRLNGRVAVHSEDRAAGEAPALNFDAQIDKSTLRDYPLSLDARGTATPQPDGMQLRVEALKLASAATTLTASGQLSPPFDAKAQLRSPDLAQLYPGASGKLDLDLQLQGSAEQPHLIAHGNGSRLRYGAQTVATLKLDADLDPLQPSQLRLTLADANAGLRIAQAALSVDGTLAYHHVDLKADTERGKASLQLQGGYDRQRGEWGGQLAQLSVAPDKLPSWTLTKPAGLLLGAQRLSLERSCLAGDGGQACFDVIRAVLQPGIRTRWQLDAVQLAPFKALLSRSAELAGRLDGDGELYWVDGDVGAASANLRLGEGRYAQPGLPAFEFQPSTLTLEQQAQRLHAVLALRTAQGTIDADLAAAEAAQFAARPLSGTVRVRIPDLAFAALFTREVAALKGHIDGDLRLAGTAAAPRLEGRMQLADASARLVTPGIELTQLNVSLSGNGDGPLAIDGSVMSGGGRLQLGGSVDPTRVPLRLDLKLAGEHFLALSSVDARVFVSPDLQLRSDDTGMHLDGKLVVPEADITPQGFGGGGQSVSADEVIVGQEQPPQKEATKFFATLQLVLGEAVRIKGFGLTTRMTGAVTLNQSPQHATSALGELRLVDGRYKAYGQDLSIETGRLIFDGGPVTQPAVDIGAYRRPSQDIRVGVRVRGTLDKPQLSLDSQPSMAREQQLSWLLFGRPLDQNSTADRSALSSAAVSLGLSGGGLLAERIGKGVGLDDIKLGTPGGSGDSITGDASSIAGSQAARGAGTGSTSSAALTLGKYLTPKLYVSYGVSLFQPGQTFRMLYDLGHGFKLQSESGVANGGDVIYSFERGH